MPAPTPIRPVELEPRHDIVRVCRDLLERAEAGEIRGIAIAADAHPGATLTAHALGDGSVSTLVCAIERVKIKLLSIGEP